LAEKVGDLIADTNRAYFNRRSRKDKHSHNIPITIANKTYMSWMWKEEEIIIVVEDFVILQEIVKSRKL